MNAKEICITLKDNARLVIVVLLAVLWLLFLLQNMEQVQVSFLFWSFSTPRALLLLATLCIGVVIGLLVRFGRRTRKESVAEAPKL